MFFFIYFFMFLIIYLSQNNRESSYRHGLVAPMVFLALRKRWLWHKSPSTSTGHQRSPLCTWSPFHRLAVTGVVFHQDDCGSALAASVQHTNRRGREEATKRQEERSRRGVVLRRLEAAKSPPPKRWEFETTSLWGCAECTNAEMVSEPGLTLLMSPQIQNWSAWSSTLMMK